MIQGLYNLDPLSSLFYDFFLFLEHKVRVTGWGEAPPPPSTFLEENCFCLSIRHMLKAEYL